MIEDDDFIRRRAAQRLAEGFRRQADAFDEDGREELAEQMREIALIAARAARHATVRRDDG